MSAAQQTSMPRRLALGALLLAGAFFAQAQGASAAAPQWSLSLSSFPSSFAAGATGDATAGPAYRILATNSGDGPTTSPYQIADLLPPELAPLPGQVKGKYEYTVENLEGKVEVKAAALACTTTGQEVSCETSQPLGPGLKAEVIVPVEVATGSAGKASQNQVTVQGGGAAPAQASLKTAIGLPAWRLPILPAPTDVGPGETGKVFLTPLNIGGSSTVGPATLTVTLPAGLVPDEGIVNSGGLIVPCPLAGQTYTCTYPEALAPGRAFSVVVKYTAEATAQGTLPIEASLEGGGASPLSGVAPATISPALAPFGFLPGEIGFATPQTGADGTAATQAGSHPYQLNVDMAFPSGPGDGGNLEASAAGALRDAIVDLPPGEIVNPNSTQVRCEEAQLITGTCPLASQIGTATITTPFPKVGVIAPATSLYNMVPAPGTPSTFGFNGAGVGIYTHITGSLRSDGDYGLTGSSKEIFGRGGNPVLGARLAFWGDPSNSGHDAMRGKCGESGPSVSCPAEEETETALLTAPVQCTGQPTTTHARADSWEEPGVFKSAEYESADLEGNPVAIGGCNQLQYEPSIEARPTTNLADSPSGLDVDVHQPTGEDPGGISPAMLRDLSLALPEGISVNPSSADGLGACTEAQAHIHTLIAGECPNDSKLGSAEAITPLLDHPVSGALYLAEPFHNPSNSLIALYLELSDPSTGTVSNIAGRVIADPLTGQLTTVFEDNPQLPIEDIKTHLFTGPRAALRTPAACGSYESKAELTPWSAPETAVAHVSDPWQIEASPNGGACPERGRSLPDTLSFTAGTLSPQAGDYTPFVLKLARKDDTQQLQKIDVSLPPGLSAKLAGIRECSEAAIASAISRSKPNEGILERGDPSCPAASRVGTVDVAAGAGITPLHTPATAYLAGPYEGAPLSLVVITPAIAGPFDLGTVVVRTALRIDPETAGVTGTSDPLPSILYGIPLDIRQIVFQLDRDQFTLNPTSCDPMSVAGSLTTTAGTLTPLSVPFQVGNCSALGFRPKLSLTLKGPTKRTSHPRLIANLRARPGDANIAMTQVKLPRAAFLDQGHIGTVCTRLQFAADACPPQSVYGKASATTPLLDYPLAGSVYLRSSAHLLPDLVAKLQGPASQPIEVDLLGRTDSVKGALRNTFEAVPDAPVRSFHLELFGGKRGLIELSSGLCARPRAVIKMNGQNGKTHDTNPIVHTSCPQKHKHRRGAGGGR